MLKGFFGILLLLVFSIVISLLLHYAKIGFSAPQEPPEPPEEPPKEPEQIYYIVEKKTRKRAASYKDARPFTFTEKKE